MTPEKLREFASDIGSRHPDESAQVCLMAAHQIDALLTMLHMFVIVTEAHHRHPMDLDSLAAYNTAKATAQRMIMDASNERK